MARRRARVARTSLGASSLGGARDGDSASDSGLNFQVNFKLASASAPRLRRRPGPGLAAAAASRWLGCQPGSASDSLATGTGRRGRPVINLNLNSPSLDLEAAYYGHDGEPAWGLKFELPQCQWATVKSESKLLALNCAKIALTSPPDSEARFRPGQSLPV